jgi:hypothetical protein
MTNRYGLTSGISEKKPKWCNKIELNAENSNYFGNSSKWQKL